MHYFLLKKLKNNIKTFLFIKLFFLNKVLEEEETQHFFKNILPGIINLALQLPDIVPCSIPLLKCGTARTLSMSQLQIACLLANAFLCTFPWRKDIAATYPGINFFRLLTTEFFAFLCFNYVNVFLFRLFAAQHRLNAVAEKLKCVCHYFRRVLEKCTFFICFFVFF